MKKIIMKRLSQKEKETFEKSGFYIYEIRYGDDGEPSTVEKRVFVNFFGTLLSSEEIKINGDFAFFNEVMGGEL
jgi:FKBP-type peptidyl-prolyl cis-trans isomerase